MAASNSRVGPEGLIEGALLAAITVLLGLMAIYIPPLQLIIRFLYPVPIVILTVRRGVRVSLMATLVAGLITVMVTGPLSGLMLVLGFGPIGLVLGAAFESGCSAVKAFAVGMIAFLFSQAALFLLALLVMGINPLAASFEALEISMENALVFYQELGLFEEGELRQLEETFRHSIQIVGTVLPGLFLIGTFLTTALNFSVAVRILKRLSYSVNTLPPFRSWRLPGELVWVLLAAIGMALITGSQFGLEPLLYLGYNLIAVTVTLLIVQGLSVGYHLAEKHSLPRWLRIVIVVLLFINAYFLLAVMILGLLDTRFNFRGHREVEAGLPSFSRWFFPRPLFWGFAAGLVLMLVGNRVGIHRLATAGVLLQALFGFVFLLQGLAVGFYFLERYTSLWLIKVLVVALVVLFPLLAQVVVVTGMLDVWFDYRGLGGGEDEDEGKGG